MTLIGLDFVDIIW